MRKLIPALAAAVLLVSACSQHTLNTGKVENSQPIFATMQMVQDTFRTGEKVALKFTVHNTADTVQQFCKWHTPFEPLMSKYLDVTSTGGEEANYQGPMAKRVMPPPADSYVKVNPGDSLSVEVDVLKAYSITTPAKYTVRYNSKDISGLTVKDSVEFVYAP
jgi:hypothetical protein